jgi:hypothetical protein
MNGNVELVVAYLKVVSIVTYLCYVGPCHHGMACSRVADGRDSLQIWRVAANILNKQWLVLAVDGWILAWI